MISGGRSEVLDQFGNLVGTDTSSITLSVNSGPAGLSGTTTVAAVGGIATFSAAFPTIAGNYVLQATDGTLAKAFTSLAVAAAAAAQLAFSPEPGGATAGSAITPAVNVVVEDQFGNTVTTDSSTVTLSVNSGPGSLTGTTTATVSSGIAKFSNLILNTVGSYTFKATDDTLTSAISTSFTVRASTTAAKLAFGQQPSAATAGAAISPAITVFVEDSGGNVVTTDNSTITLSIASGPGALGGTVTVQAINGVATFNNLILNTAGTYTLKAADGSLTSATSNSFNVAAAAASKLVFSQQPSSVVAGAAISPAVTMSIEDQFGNIATTNTSTVTLAVNTGPGALGGTTTVAAVAGVATFSNPTLTSAGSYTLKATDGALTIAISSSFTVSPAAASKLVFTQQPSGAMAGVAIAPAVTVSIEDQFGNIITTHTSSVALAINTGPGSLAGTTTVAAVNGVATFNNLILGTAGSYTLKATDGSLTSAISNSFTVNPTSGLPAGWTDSDIGSPALAGSASVTSGTWTLNGGGADIWSGSNQFNYASESISGDTTIIVHVATLTNTNSWTKAGVMFRDGTSPTAAYINLVVSAGNGIALQYRTTTSGSPQNVQVTGKVAPQWLKLVRTGNSFTGFYSSNGTTWTAIGPTVSITTSAPRVGLAVTAHDNTKLATATFDNVSVS